MGTTFWDLISGCFIELFTIDNDGIKDMIAVGENRPADASGDIAEAQILKGELPLSTFEAPEKFGNGLGSLPS